MPYLLTNLEVDRVDLVDEGANSAAFIELFKRKETGANMKFDEIIAKLSPEHAAIVLKTVADANAAADVAKNALTAKEVELTKAATELAKANTELAVANTELTKVKTETVDLKKSLEAAEKEKAKDGDTSFDETEAFKNMPAEARVMLMKMRSEKTAAEQALAKAKDAEKTASALAKASTLKSIPLPMEELVDVIKTCPDKVVGMLEVINASIDEMILTEVGKSLEGTVMTSMDSWGRIEKAADAIVARDGVTKQRAIAQVIKEQPDLYKAYIQGGAN